MKKKNNKINKDAFKNVPKVNETSAKASDQDSLESDDFFGPLINAFKEIYGDNFPSSDSQVSEEEFVISGLVNFLREVGVTPEEYTKLYTLFEKTATLFDKYSDIPDISEKELKEKISDEMTNMFFEEFGDDANSGKNQNKTLQASGNSKKTLVLKIQLKGVAKPPMWREVEVPDNYSFRDLHDIIQIVTGLENCHLWQFGKKAYGDGVKISMPHDDPFGFEYRNEVLNADETPLSKFLTKKGDKLEYVYDFGDDWIFEVKVVNVLDKEITQPICTKFKSDLNAFEDLGGPYMYVDIRDYADPNSEMSAYEKKSLGDRMADYFESVKGFKDYIKTLKFDIKRTNKILMKM